MYSVVLLMALSGGAEAPDCHKSCGGCSGCSGYSGCHGGVVSTCHGCSGYSGCSGSCHGGGHRLFGGHGGCHGGGLFGGRHGCHGGSGCHGGYSGCCGGYVGCCGGAMMAPCGGGCAGCAGSAAPPPPKGEKLESPPKEKKPGKDEVSAPATIVLTLPADATVAIDGVSTTSTSATRTFVTPELVPAKEFVYVLSAEIVRDGQKLTVSEKVTVRAGEETRVNFGSENFSTLTVAGK
jgi:uncharacterized protein (TIGR03000 family)